MKKTVIAVAVSFLSAGAYAGDLNLNSDRFEDLSPAQIKTSSIELPIPAAEVRAGAKCNHVSGEITKLHLLAQTGKSVLFTYADTEPLFNEFVTMWKPILEKFSLKPTTTEYKNSFGKLNYESADGLVVRDFMAEKLHYDALNAAEVSKLQHALLEPLEQAGMTPIASFTIKHEAFRPTFNIYYLTKPNENPDHEVQLRQLMNGDDIDFDLLADSVKIVKQDTSFSMVYIGKLVGFKSKWSDTEAGINTKLADYKKFLKDNNKEFIASRIVKLDKPEVIGDITINYYVNVYFFQ